MPRENEGTDEEGKLKVKIIFITNIQISKFQRTIKKRDIFINKTRTYFLYYYMFLYTAIIYNLYIIRSFLYTTIIYNLYIKEC